METKWTPGPWLHGQDGFSLGNGVVYVRRDGGLKDIATVRGWDDQRQADTALIAAAPELYAELSHLVRLLEPMERDGSLNVPGLATLNGARAALAKARGE